jgi:imidazolonepropionase-like amidohydrolase
MKERRILQLPSLFSFSSAPPEHVSALRSHIRDAIAAGLPIAFGTDAGVIPHGQNAREFEHLTAIRLDRPAALRAATIDGARAVGMAAEIGVLSAGRF